MNKNGFAISIILYSIVFLIIAILYMLLGLAKTRYTVNKSLRDNIVNDLNVERSDYEYTSSESCTITGNTTDYTTDLMLTINVTNYGKTYKFNNGSWSNNNKLLVDHSGTYIGYFRDTNGGVGNCSCDVTSKTVYRYRDCASDDYIYGEEYYDASGNLKKDIIGCKFEKNEQWSNWSDIKPESKVTRQIDYRISYKIK